MGKVNSMKRGIVFSSFNKESALEVNRAVQRIREVMPDIHITVYSQHDVIDSDYYVKIARMHIPGVDLPPYPHQGFYWKVKNAGLGVCETNIFMDTDTWLVKPIYEVFEMIESGKYHIAACHDATQFNRGVPKCFPSLNTGFIAYDSSAESKELFALWWKYFVDRDSVWDDQPAFQSALYDSGISFCAMHPEYNLRFIFPVCVWGEVMMLHGRTNDNYQDIADELNERHDDQRLWMPRYSRHGQVICRYNLGEVELY